MSCSLIAAIGLLVGVVGVVLSLAAFASNRERRVAFDEARARHDVETMRAAANKDT